MIIIRAIIFIVFPIIFSCVGAHSSTWQAYTFDGFKFTPANDNSPPAIWIRSGHSPKTADPDSSDRPAERLPPGSGAVAGICYRQTAGGKIAPQNSFAPYPDEQITLKNRSAEVSVSRTDKDGYFNVRLPAGDYELFCRGVRAEVTVKNGETALLPIRGGKRMAD